MRAIGRSADPAERPATAPPQSLWLAAIAAVILAGSAFALWGLNGAGILVDIVTALCG